jgi:hypothetical protein
MAVTLKKTENFEVNASYDEQAGELSGLDFHNLKTGEVVVFPGDRAKFLHVAMEDYWNTRRPDQSHDELMAAIWAEYAGQAKPASAA